MPPAAPPKKKAKRASGGGAVGLSFDLDDEGEEFQVKKSKKKRALPAVAAEEPVSAESDGASSAADSVPQGGR